MERSNFFVPTQEEKNPGYLEKRQEGFMKKIPVFKGSEGHGCGGEKNA